MARCAGCGGVLGRDCWNEQDCVWITQDMLRQAARQPDPRDGACQGCSVITGGGYSPCSGLCEGASSWEDIEAREVAYAAIRTTFAPAPPARTHTDPRDERADADQEDAS